MEDRKLELELQLERRRMDEIHSELEQMLRHARRLSEESRKRVRSSMGLSHKSRMFSRH
jgi:hypothetical protein